MSTEETQGSVSEEFVSQLGVGGHLRKLIKSLIETLEEQYILIPRGDGCEFNHHNGEETRKAG